MQIVKNPPSESWQQLMQRPTANITALFDYVKPVMDDISSRGDAALREYTMRFDGYSSEEIEVNIWEIESAVAKLNPGLKQAINVAARNIEKFHSLQQQSDRETETMPGVRCVQKYLPIEKVGLYIPGGSAPLFSTVLMLGIPARLAGCSDIVMCTPPAKDGTIDPAILYTAQLVGITRIFKLGGIQAIAAMTYGTETVPAVYKIFGPGNSYVMAAKQWAALAKVAIDMPAGPSEVLVMADDSANPEFVAADLLSQAEHGADSQVIMLTTSAQMLDKVAKEVEKQVQQLPREYIAVKALDNSKLILLQSIDEMMEFSNMYAPEHLILSVKNYRNLIKQIKSAGSVFLGNYTPESAGDYASGTNHTLPTNGFANSYSGVNLLSFMKSITIQEIMPEALEILGPVIETMAEAEQLQAHKNAVTVRLKALS